ncbi:MAG TPA: GAF domain-containing protein [Thermomicrobiaceae bacterium]|nr:GAF domain-containing protein [Thermomicrobiaceae bacterium]
MSSEIEQLNTPASRADWVRGRISQVVETATPRLRLLAEPFEVISDDEISHLVRQYLELLALLLDAGQVGPLWESIEGLVERWGNQVGLDDAVRGFFTISDILRAAADPSVSDQSLVQVDRWTREIVIAYTNRGVLAVATRLEGEVERHRIGEERLISLQRISTAVTSDLDLDRTLTVIVEETCRLMHTSVAAIRLVDGGGEQLRLIASAGKVNDLHQSDQLPVDGSLAGYSLRHGVPVVSNHAARDERLSHALRERTRLGSLLIVPLRVRERPIGVLLVGDRQTGRFGMEDQTLMSLFADQAASAIENGRLYQQAQEQIAELAALQRISSVISSSLDLDAVFRAIYDEIRQVMPATMFMIGLEQEDGHYDFEFIVDHGKMFSPVRGVQLSPIFERAMAERRHVVIGDLNAIPDHGMQSIGPEDFPPRSIVAAPLLKSNRRIGLLTAQSEEPFRYRESDGRLLMTIASYAVVAIDHARLYQDAQRLAVAEERNRLAREIHDTLAQGLVGIILYLERLDQEISPEDRSKRQVVERALSLARGNLEEARRSVHDLRAAPLEGRTLDQALARLVEDTRKDTGIDVELHTSGNLPLVTARVETALFRMAQEALSNSRKHACCDRAEVRLAADGSAVTLAVSDNGAGFEVADKLGQLHRFGLSTMRERISQVGGEFSVDSKPGAGTTVSARIPLDRATHIESGI